MLAIKLYRVLVDKTANAAGPGMIANINKMIKKLIIVVSSMII
jgi:hypothetical protein